MKSYLREILSILPKHCYSFAYGSAVFKQTPTITKLDDKLQSNQQEKLNLPIKANNIRDKMIDFIVVVDDSLEWHQENLAKNSSHYSFLKYFGARTISKVQEEFGANCYFNTLIPYNNETLIKYGVIKKAHLINDLLDWDHLYISGRLQKPVQTINFDHTMVRFTIYIF